MPFAAGPPRQEEMKDWDVESAIATYNVDGWGGGYFTVNAEGNVIAKPLQENGGSITILEVVNEARSRCLVANSGSWLSSSLKNSRNSSKPFGPQTKSGSNR